VSAAAGRAGLDDPHFGSAAPFALGIEEELLLVDPASHALSHTAPALLEGMAPTPAREGSIHLDTYAALVELASPVARGAQDGVAHLAALRARLRAAGATLLGAGIHPAGRFGDVVHVPQERYLEVARQLRGLLRRTPTCALHVHVGMPDAERAVQALNGLREHLPLLQALAAASPFWHGTDSGLASARAQLFRGYPRADIPDAAGSWDEYAERVAAVVAAADAPDYTFLWSDLRLHPRLGTLELRAMDAQAPLWSVAALAGLVHALARAAAEEPDAARRAPTPRAVLMEGSYRGARDGLATTLWDPAEERLRPAAELAREQVARLRPLAGDLGGSGEALELVERLLVEGGGAARQRAAHARGGMPELLALLAGETAAPA
jgi:carboxylate-amine ligase